MIIKLRNGNNKKWLYLDAQEVYLEGEQEIQEGVRVLSQSVSEAKLLSYRTVTNGRLEQIHYDYGYLLNDKGDTINSI